MRFIILLFIGFSMYAQGVDWRSVEIDSAAQYTNEIRLTPNEKIIGIGFDTDFLYSDSSAVDTISFLIWKPTTATYSAGSFLPMYYEGDTVEIAVGASRFTALNPDKFMGISRFKIKIDKASGSGKIVDDKRLYYAVRRY